MDRHRALIGRTAKAQRLMKRVSIKQLFILLSVSLFSLVFSCSGFLRPFNPYAVSTFPFRLCTHTVNKNCIFLICNGILVFLAKSSGLIKGSRFRSNITSHRAGQEQAKEPLHQEREAQMFEYEDERLSNNLTGLHDDSTTESADDQYHIKEVDKESEVLTKLVSEASALVGGEEKIIEEHETYGESTAKEEGELLPDQIGDDDQRDDPIMEHEDEEEEEEAEDEEVMFGSKVLSTEELNKKFDEFIRKMKEEIRIEDQKQQLVMV